ncbi:MAG TPA: hypothetical protein VEF06_03395 [Bryobacteraceae bacterium]|nr:hypothetical protein [Bryobacteraceae bacterium]
MPSVCLKRSLSRRESFRLAFGSLCARYLCGAETASHKTPDLAAKIPPRQHRALTGSQFSEFVAGIEGRDRERAILHQLLAGNLPDFLRKFVPVEMSCETPGKAKVSATIFVMPEYLAIGSDADFLRIPMNLYTARAVADRFHCVFPTRKMVDAIYDQSGFHFTPQPLPAGPQMRSTEYYRRHNGMIEKQSEARGIPSGPLVAGHKKDVVLTNRLARNPGQIAIYGWHRGTADPIQPLSTVHGAGYADYSHGIRLISDRVLVDGKCRSLSDVLRDPLLAKAFSDEGSLREVLDMWARQPAAA